MPLVLSGTNGISTNGTNWALQPDSSGRVTMPYQPVFHAYFGGTGVFSSTGVITFDSTAINVGNCYNTANGRFTAPVSGVYEFTVDELLRNGAFWAFRKNGSAIFGGSDGAVGIINSGATYVSCSKTIKLQLAAGDYITVSCISAGDGWYADWCAFSGQLLG